MAAPSGLDLVTSTNTKIDHHDDSSNEPTPGGPLTPERIKELGIIKMNDYLSTGTRQQFWEEYYVKVVMQVSVFSRKNQMIFHEFEIIFRLCVTKRLI